MSHSEAFVRVVDESKLRIREMTIEETVELLRQKNDKSLIETHSPILVDTREDLEWQASRIPGAIHLGRGVIERDVEARIPDKNTKIVLYCGGGFRSALAAEMLQKMGYQDVYSMAGGIRGWREKKLPEDFAPAYRVSIQGQLLITPRSPFARRVRLFCKRNRLDIAETEVNPFEPSEEFLKLNPLGMVPVLKILKPEEEVFFDSDTILDVLDGYGYTLWGNVEFKEKRVVQKLSRMATGIMTAAVAYYLEKLKGKNADLDTLKEHEANILRTLTVLQTEKLDWIASFSNQALWDIGVALDYCELRVPHLQCEKNFEKLYSVILCACKRLDSYFEQTKPPQ